MKYLRDRMGNLIQSENVEWVLLHPHTHIDALQKSVISKIFKTSSYSFVSNATKHVRLLNPNHEAPFELQKVLDGYIAGKVNL
jgi:hypothetical protein